MSKKHKGNSNVGGVQLYLGGMALGEVDSFKYLGVLFHKHLTWSEHISGIYNKAKKILGLIYRQFYNNSSSTSLKQLYLSARASWLIPIQSEFNPHPEVGYVIRIRMRVNAFTLDYLLAGDCMQGCYGADLYCSQHCT
ncbi:hypothetical protein AB9K17_23755, partial [Salmonella enterica subsp. enterica serovar Kentucky]|uniref:hypothetical protein n=1 Tax=Salmonella enterica TaxID=28901 RepID=UPI003F4B44AD